MGTNETNIYELNGKLDNYYQSIIITFDIKNIMLITDIIYTVYYFFYYTASSSFPNPCKASLISAFLCSLGFLIP